MTFADLIELLEFSRVRTLGTLEAIAKEPDSAKILGWRPAPGRAHIGWQLMHIAATDDRHIHVRMTGGQPSDAELVRRFMHEFADRVEFFERDPEYLRLVDTPKSSYASN